MTRTIWPALRPCRRPKSRRCSTAAGTAFRGRCSPSGGTTRTTTKTSAGPTSSRRSPSRSTGKSTGATISAFRSRSRWGGTRRTRKGGSTASRSCTAAPDAPTRVCASTRWSRHGASGRPSRTTRCSGAESFRASPTRPSSTRAGARASPPWWSEGRTFCTGCPATTPVWRARCRCTTG